MHSPLTYPVQALREHLTELEAALSVCLADPDVKPVHKLRTETRRAEALLLLLALVPGLPEHRKQAAAFLRAISKLRRAAGKVRDLDVHRKMLESLTSPQDTNASIGSATQPAKKKSGVPADVSNSATHLRKHMGTKRDKAASSLQKLLEKRQPKTARAAENLMDVLQPAEDLAVKTQDLLHDADAVLTRDGLLEPGKIPLFSEEDLHTVRKAAKAARYVAESAGNDPALGEAARAFESLQDAGGQWHDALELGRASRRCFGKKHPLTALYEEERDRKLKAYRAALQTHADAKTVGNAKTVGDAKTVPSKRKPAKRALSKRSSAA